MHEISGRRKEDENRAECEHAGPENKGERRELLQGRDHQGGTQTQAEPEPSKRHAAKVCEYFHICKGANAQTPYSSGASESWRRMQSGSTIAALSPGAPVRAMLVQGAAPLR